MRHPLPPDRPLGRRSLVAAAIATALVAAAPGGADGLARADDGLVLDGQVGPAFLMKSRSSAVGHGFKPVARLGLRAAATRRLEIGGSVSGVVDSSEHYRVLGALAHGRVALWQLPGFSLGAALGLGAGYNADILHDDLSASAPLAPYGLVSLDARWPLGERWLVGVEAGWDNLSIARLGLLVGVRFDGRAGHTLPDR